METGRWNGHVFEVSPDVIRGFTGLSIKASCDTEEQETDGQQYVKRKVGKPLESSLTVHLCAYLGCDVRDEAYAFLSDARSGAQDYFYVGNGKLDTCQLMLTNADTEEIGIAPDGTWIRCDVKLTLKQCTKHDGTVSGTGGDSGDSGGGGDDGGAATAKKASVKTTSYLGSGAGTSLSKTATAQTATASEYIQKAVDSVNAAKAASAKSIAQSRSEAKITLGR